MAYAQSAGLTVSSDTNTPYDGMFYEAIADASSRSADRILPLIVDLVHPTSVIDIGCGTGEWLRSLHDLVQCEIMGLDGDYVARDTLRIPIECFIPHDLEEPIRLNRRFDLAISLEVAEHLPKARAESFVSDLTAIAPAILFSAAIPGQGGVGHVNEQWQSYWADLFAQNGFRACDVVRPSVWGCDDVSSFYRQNTLLFVDPAVHDFPTTPLPLMDIVHPRLLEQIAARRRPATLRELVMQMPSALRRSFLYRRDSLWR